MSGKRQTGPMRCPRCKQRQSIKRARRHGIENTLSVLGIYPFRCTMCFHRFRRFVPGLPKSTEKTAQLEEAA